MTLEITLVAIFVLTSIATFGVCAAAHQVLFGYRLAVQQRMAWLAENEPPAEAMSLFKELSAQDGHRIDLRTAVRTWLQTLLERAAISWSPKTFVLVCLASGLLAGLLAVGVWGPWAGLIAGPAGSIPLAIAFAKRNARQRKLTEQLPEVFQIISRAVRAGQTVPAALRIIAEDHASPAREEFALCYEQQDLGMSRELALRKLGDRTQVMELQIFVVALLVQNRSGGDLGELLDNLARLVQTRLRMRTRIRALTGEGRMQATVLILLPVLAFLAIWGFSPDYAALLLDRPGLLLATAASQSIGAFWIHRIVNFKY
ncbi:type II secretion system F family protein [Roseimaritima sediminicola]|uniref:type II secretion system F family protein n=1 Tax=Roseimaritima sediminicola TaxID=2662066 RepID=UPI0012983097|nr:type II secretion system F family protein [Roseimaritima sediminicola]